MTMKRYKNVKNIPAPDGSRPKRVSLNIDSKGQIKDAYWKRRFNEGCLEEIKDVPETKPKKNKETPLDKGTE